MKTPRVECAQTPAASHGLTLTAPPCRFTTLAFPGCPLPPRCNFCPPGTSRWTLGSPGRSLLGCGRCSSLRPSRVPSSQVHGLPLPLGDRSQCPQPRPLPGSAGTPADASGPRPITFVPPERWAFQTTEPTSSSGLVIPYLQMFIKCLTSHLTGTR